MVDVTDSAPIPRNVITGFARLIDVLGCVASAAAAFGIYYYGQNQVPDDSYYAIVGLAVVVQLCMFQFWGLYRKEALRKTFYQIPRVWTAWTCVVIVLIVVLFATKLSASYSRGWMVFWYLSGFITFGLIRIGLMQYFHHGIRHGRLQCRLIVIGGGNTGQQLMSDLRGAEPEVQVLGYFDDREDRVPKEIDGFHKLGKIGDIIEFGRSNRVDAVVLALPVDCGERLSEILRIAYILPVDIYLSGNATGIRFTPDIYDYIANIPLLSVIRRPITGWNFILKSIEDRFVAILAMVLSLPIMILIAIAIKIDSPGPVFFRQMRYGFNNKVFEVWKFRTMYADAADLDCQIQTTRHDTRVTRVGAILRKTSLDELPQLFNVLKGEMSIVGPRPHALETKAQGQLLWDVVNEYAARHKVKPGITGWAQVNGWRGETESAEKIRHRVHCDLYYIENWSIWLDVWIILKTVPLIFYDKKAY